MQTQGSCKGWGEKARGEPGQGGAGAGAATSRYPRERTSAPAPVVLSGKSVSLEPAPHHGQAEQQTAAGDATGPAREHRVLGP
ncbi:hypothetical protein NDU88_003245 [Pleurodeles waltl]|uniref:Uncharacterized protein n=1 Tax=Pleurodeles waltl TaxID=8319 RepID=A0AAV7TNH1_PLEWA|nr:hypothetical protein NDU88_003245 [Pleurodeles waltl]